MVCVLLDSQAEFMAFWVFPHNYSISQEMTLELSYLEKGLSSL